MNELAKVFTTRQRPHEAIAILAKAGPVIRRTLGERHPRMSMRKANLAQAHVRAQRWSEAETLIKELLQAVPKDHPDAIVALSGYIFVCVAMGRLKEAQIDCLKALDELISGNQALHF